ncbi:MAG: ATP-binding protein [Fibrobacteres bacterium]|jgi:predicted AAA+ superfamily ATPase|nr:ATP-binding protein [Fibrobacterota bacterium]
MSRKRSGPRPQQSFFLFGPRGTGKSTWVNQLLPDALHLDLLRQDLWRELDAKPERLRSHLEAFPDKEWIFVDEIQKIPVLLDEIHRAMEAHPHRKWALTGSSARKLKRGAVNLLGGRALRQEMHPYLASELGGDFHLESALRFGLVPLVRESPDPEATLATYAGMVLREEVHAEGLVRNLSAYSRFLETLSFSQGSQLNLANVSRECGVDRKTLDGYLSVTEDLLLCHRLPVFAKRARRELSSHAKLYLFDAGVFRSLRPKGPLDSPEEIDGQALESLVFQHLRAWVGLRGHQESLHFWRTRNGVEVDFVVYGESTFLALEVKNSDRIQSADLRGLRSFQDDYPEARCALLYRGSQRRIEHGILCLPVDDFLRGIDPASNLNQLLA